jgi:5'-methylthioadenosine phosphorylase
MTPNPTLGIIGGSGLYDFPGLKSVEVFEMDTPYGKPSSAIVTGELVGQRVAFLARHGVGHVYTPTEVNYRANIYALKMLGVQQIISISACGSLREDYAPGHIIIPDQLVDFTRKRPSSFFGDGLVVHVGSAEPYCPDLSRLVYQSVTAAGAKSHLGGVLVTIEGPRFSTKAESNLFRSWGMSIIGMTACPEAFLAREAGICYATMAHVTDYDVWHLSEEPVSVEMVVKTLHANTALAQQAIRILVETLPVESSCQCEDALKDAIITNPQHITPELKEKYHLLTGKFLTQ